MSYFTLVRFNTVDMSGTIVVKGGVLVTNGVSLNTDSFGVVKVAQPYPIFTSMSVRGSNSLAMDVGTTGGGTVTMNTNVAAANAGTYTLTAAGAGASAIRQSYSYSTYIPGVGKQMMFTGILQYGQSQGSFTTGQAYTRIGLFDGYNGMYWSYDASGVVSVNICRSLSKTGTTYTTTIPQSLFNVNTLQVLTVPGQVGTAPINWAKMQVFYIDQEWLGAGSVRFGVYVNDVLIIAHVVTNFNTLLGPYTPMPNAPVRYDAICTEAGKSISVLEGCATVSLNAKISWPPVTNTTLAYCTALATYAKAETVILALRGSTTASTDSPYYTAGAYDSLTLTSVACVLTTADTVVIRVYRVFVRGGTSYGTYTPATAFANPYPGLPYGNGDTLGPPACLVEVSTGGTLALTANTPQLMATFASTETNRFGGTNTSGAARFGVSLNNVADIYVITAQNIGSGDWRGSILTEWSQET